MSASSTVEVYLSTGPAPDPTFSNVVALAIAAGALMYAISFARRRSAPPRKPAPSHFIRVLAAAGFFAAALKSGEAAFAYFQPDAAPMAFDWVFQMGVSVAVTLLLLFWLTDRLIAPFRPARDLFWLATALVGFVILVLLSAYASSWNWEPEPFALDTYLLRMVMSAAGAGLVWWALLPCDEEGLAEVFE